MTVGAAMKCKECGNPFRVSKRQRVYCSQYCAEQNRKLKQRDLKRRLRAK